MYIAPRTINTDDPLRVDVSANLVLSRPDDPALIKAWSTTELSISPDCTIVSVGDLHNGVYFKNVDRYEAEAFIAALRTAVWDLSKRIWNAHQAPQHH